jgi:hypothetical protein
MKSDNIPISDSWHAMFIVDSSLWAEPGERYLPWDAFRPRRVTNNVTIPDLSNYIYSLSYKRSLSTQKSKLCYLLSKVLNEKCQARKFSSVFLDCYEPKHNIAKYIKSIVLCGLLGAYPTSPASSRPRPEVRKKLYELISNCSYIPVQANFSKSEGEEEQKRRHRMHAQRKDGICKVCMVDSPHGGPQAEQWFLYLMTLGGIVVLYCIREYIHYMLQSNPSLLDKIKEEIKFDETYKVTQEAMCTIRKYFDDHLTNPFSDMYQFTDDVMEGRRVFNPSSLDNSDPSSWFYQLSCIMYPYQRSMLLISHHRSNKTMQESLLTACKKLNMIPLPSATEKQQQEQQHAEILEHIEEKSYLYDSSIARLLQQQQQQQATEMKSSEPNLEENSHDAIISEHRKMISLCIKPSQLKAIEAILRRTIKNDRSDAIVIISKFLRLFGVDSNTKQFIRDVITKRKQNKISDEKLRSFLVTLQKKKPHAYNLLQATAYISHNLVAFSINCILPRYITLNQISAIQSRFGSYMIGSHLIPSTACTIYYCSVCQTIYSIIRDFMYNSRQSHEYGVLNALVDHDTGHMYCKNNVTNGIDSCKDTPLVSINILGLMMRIKDQPIMLCPQLHCGSPMVYSNQCTWTERGPCCSKCTVKKNSDFSVKLDTASSLLDQVFDKSDPTTYPDCAICGSSLCSLGKMFWYPESVIVCCYHTSSSIQKKFKELYMPDMTREQVIELIKNLLFERSVFIERRRRSKDARMRILEEKKRKNGLGVSFDQDDYKSTNNDDPMDLG